DSRSRKADFPESRFRSLLQSRFGFDAAPQVVLLQPHLSGGDFRVELPWPVFLDSIDRLRLSTFRRSTCLSTSRLATLTARSLHSLHRSASAQSAGTAARNASLWIKPRYGTFVSYGLPQDMPLACGNRKR